MTRSFFVFFALGLVACSPKPVTAPAAKSSAPERRVENATLWSAKTELFLEYPVLVQDQESRFAIHLTQMSGFKPVAAGRCEVRVTYAGGISETFSTDAPAKAGIFGVTVKPSHAGDARVEIRLTSAAISDVHTLERIPVFATLNDAPIEAKAPSEETIRFLKEQQWAMDFATSLTRTASLRDSLRVPAEVTPRSGGEAEITAPLAGRLTGESLPALGARVQQGQVLASLIPPTSVPSDRAGLDLARAEAEAALDYARRDKERATRLVTAGAAPAKRLDETVTAERTLTARLHAAEERIRQFESSRAAEGAAGLTAFAIRAPFSGTIVETKASAGATLKGGEMLFRIVDTERVYVSAIVPEAQYPDIRNLTGAEIEIPGLARPRPAGRLISIGKVVDPATRTFPVVYEFANSDGRIAINQTVTIRLFLSSSRRGAIVPEGALVDDGGRPVVFVQVKGEAFARRPVETGLRQTGLVQITSGLEAGERVVTRGAYLIRLAAMSSQIPAHGHVH